MDRVEVLGRDKGVLPWAGASHVGLVRLGNEDYLLVRPDLGLWIVCDGLGGHGQGDEASVVAARSIADGIAGGSEPVPALIAADEMLRRHFDQGKGLELSRPPGCTVVLLRIGQDRWDVAWVGDCRAWCWDGSELKPLTTDHTMVQEMVAAGAMTREEALESPMRHVVTQALGLGGREVISPGLTSGDYEPGRLAFLLASDGLPVRMPEIPSIFRSASGPQHAVDALVEMSLSAGGPDNVTVSVVDWRKSP